MRVNARVNRVSRAGADRATSCKNRELPDLAKRFRICVEVDPVDITLEGKEDFDPLSITNFR